jgi:hypothetical protein
MNRKLIVLSIVVLLAREAVAQELRQGPYHRLVIRGAMVVPGHGGPAYGPADVVVEGDTIVHIVSVPHEAPTASRPTGDRVIEAEGLWLMPGLIDLHTHIREEPLPLEYVYFMKLAHGVTTMVHGSERGFESALEQAMLSKANAIAAPRLYPIRDWGPARSRDPGHAPPLEVIAPWHDPSKAAELAPKLVAEGAHVFRIGSLAWNRELFSAVARAVDAAGGITTVHLPPSDISVVDALDAAELGVTMIEHHYGYAEAALEGTLQGFPHDYNYSDEADRFRQAAVVWRQASEEKLLGGVVDRLVASGVSMLPTLSAYEANRDINRAMGLPWHDRYTHRLLIEWFFPNPAFHAAQHWDWTSGDEAAWAHAFRLWGRLIKTFSDRGGLLAYGADDPYFWNTSGIANVRELQLMEETGLHPLEVLRAATRNAALTLKRPDLGLVQTGFKADLLLVEGNPLKSFRYLYSFGALTLEGEEMVRRGGIRYTIKDGIVFDNQSLMGEVVKMVSESKNGWTDPRKALFEP